MARAVAVGEESWVPRRRVGQDPGDHPSPFMRANVLEVEGRSVRVSVSRNEDAWVSKAHVHRNIGILSLRIGDFGTETTLLDPLAKSVGQFCRLLLPDDYVRFVELRSVPELRGLWQREHANATIVVINGHGSKDALVFGVGGNVLGGTIAERLGGVAPDTAPKIFISLACLTGHAGFAGPFSSWAGCAALLAPFHSVHGAVASQFVQTFLVYHLLEGETVKVAFNHARERVAGAASFRMWVAGRLRSGANG
jgi:hypothetical protein